VALITDKAVKAGLILEKKGLFNPPILRVAEAIDVSGSMHGMFNNGDVQSACDQLLGAGLKLDDNGQLDVYIFDDHCSKIGTATADDAGTFVRNKLLTAGGHLWGGTAYADVIELVERDMFSADPVEGVVNAGKNFWNKLIGKPAPATTTGAVDNTPVLAFLITDGENADHPETIRALESAARYPIYWNMVGIGASRFPFLQQVADRFDNVGFIKLAGLRLSDEAMYEALFTDEFVTWAKRFPGRT
jgi:hypothetical protein